MNILFLARAVDGLSDFGDGVHVRELVGAWTAAGHRVSLVCLGDAESRGPEPLAAKFGQGSVIEFVSPVGIGRYYPSRQLIAAASALRAMRESRWDVVYARPSVGLSGTFDAVVEILISKLAGVPLVLEINGWAQDDAAELRPSRYLPFGRFTNHMTRRLFSRVDGFVAVNESLAQRLGMELRVPLDRVRVIPNGANPVLFQEIDSRIARSRVGIPQDAAVIVFVGHIGLEADLTPVFEALPVLVRHLPGLLFVVVGDGGDRLSYEHLTDSIGLRSRVVFTGRVPHEQVATYINAADLGVVAIKPHLHSNPMKLFEYWCCAKAVVGSRNMDLALIEQVGGGVLVTENSADGWVEAVSDLMRRESLRAEMGRKGRDYVLGQRTWARTADQAAEYLSTLV